MKCLGSLLLIVSLAGCAAPASVHPFEKRLHVGNGGHAIEEKEWLEIKSQISGFADYVLQHAFVSSWGVDVNMILRANGIKGRLLRFEKRDGHWQKVKDDETTVVY